MSVSPEGPPAVSLVFRDVCYSVTVKGAPRTILGNVSGHVSAGSLCALFGPSGSGKSTLLDALGGRLRGVTGSILINGKQMDPKTIRNFAGYVPQEDFLQAAMTVKENIMFSALLRLGKHVSIAEKSNRVDQVIQQLNLEKVASSLVGDGTFIRGISGGERKRTSIGMELVTAPTLLFLDEPTTGLDSSTATSVMFLLKRLARSGKTIIASIHQPKFAIWKQFDSLVLLSNGRMVYSGPARPPHSNPDADQGVLAFLARCGFVCESFNSPPDFLLDVVTEDEARQRRKKAVEMGKDPDDPEAFAEAAASKPSTRKVDPQSAAERGLRPNPSDDDGAIGQSTAIQLRPRRGSVDSIYSLSETTLPGTISTIPENNLIPLPDLFLSTGSYHAELMATIDAYQARGGEMPPAPKRERLSFPTELYYVFKRQLVSIFRNPRTWIIQVFSNILLAVIFGILFFRQGLSQESAQNRNGIAFFTVQFLVFSNMGAVELFLVDRRIFWHERSNGYYGTTSYFISKVFGDLVVLRLVPAFLFGTVIYWIVGFQADAGRFFFFVGCATTVHETVN